MKRFCQFFNLSKLMSKCTIAYIHRIIISIYISESIRRSTQGLSIRIERFVYGSTYTVSNKLDKKVNPRY